MPVADQAVDICMTECINKGNHFCDETVSQLSLILIEEGGKSMPRNADEAVLLYQFLRNEILNNLH